MQNLKPGQTITPAELAALLRITENALAKMRVDGSGPPFLKIGRRVRYPQSQTEDWLEIRSHMSTSSATQHSSASPKRLP